MCTKLDGGDWDTVCVCFCYLCTSVRKKRIAAVWPTMVAPLAFGADVRLLYLMRYIVGVLQVLSYLEATYKMLLQHQTLSATLN
jgi:hypothetical protein